MTTSKDALRIKKLREFLGYSQRELAQEFQVTSGAIAHWESGLRPIPGPVEKLISIYEETLNLKDNKESLISEEALQQSRDLLKEVLKTLQDEGVVIQDCNKKRLQQIAQNYFHEDLSRFRIGGLVKSALIKKLIKSLAGSEGLAIKAAQLASFIEMGLPPDIANILGDLQLKAKPMPFKQVQEILIAAYGDLKNFKNIQQTPLAVTSVAQLHRATLVSGDEIVLKIQSPKIAKILQGQFKKLSFLNNLGELLGASATEVLEDIQKQVYLELDYEREIYNQERFRNIFQHEPRIIIPKIYRDLCRTNIIASEFQSGLSFQAFSARANPKEKSQAALLIAYFHSYAVFNHHLMHGDAHSGNFLFQKDKVIFLDFGRIIEYLPEDFKKDKGLYRAILHKNKQKFIDYFVENNLITHPEAFDFDEFWQVMLRQQQHHLREVPFKITPEYLRSCQLEARQFKHRKMIRPNTNMLRATLVNISLLSLFANLEAEADWRKQALTFW